MILALDFDGALHPLITQREPLLCRLGLMETWLRAHVDTQVVISSTWREVHSLEAMRQFFSEDLRKRIVGTTPIAWKLFKEMGLTEEAQQGIYERQFEIETWCQSRGLSKNAWIALDDDDRLFEPSCNRLVLCDGKVGLRPGTLFKLTKKIELINQGRS